MNFKEKFKFSESFWKTESEKFSSLYGTKKIRNIPNKIFLYKRIETILKVLDQDKAKCENVLDVGCGSGEFTIMLKNYAENVVGIDYSEDMINQAKSNNNANNVNFQFGDCNDINFENNNFDRIFALGLIDYVENIEKVIIELKRVLKKGGKLIVTIPKNPTIFFIFRFFNGLRYRLFDAPPIVNALTKKEAFDIFEKNGFSITYYKVLWTTTWVLELEKL